MTLAQAINTREDIKLSNAQIAWRAAQDIADGAYVNLGIGFPEMVAQYQPEGREAIFQYFANEIFARADAPERRKLMLSAVPPSVTPAEAVALTGDADAGRMLESLYRRHLFVERRHGAQMVYHYHALFREFLLERGRCDLDDHERRGATMLAAHLLAERGQTNDALTLARGASDWQTMHELILSHAASWSRQGRGQVISDWIDALPATARDDDPWLAYWQGRAWVFVQPQRSRLLLERAWQMFRDRGETQGQALTLALLVTGCHHEWADFGYLDRWLPELERLLGSGEPLDRATELRVRAAHLIVLLFRGGSPDAQKACAARVDALVDGEGEPDARVLASSTLFNYCNWSDAPNAADALVARTTPILANADVSPLTQLCWRTHVSFWHYTNGRYSESVEVAEQARALAKRYGLEAFMFEIDHAQAQALINQGELAAAKALVDAIEPRLSPLRRMDHAYFHHLRSTLAQRLGDAASAMRHADRALMLARESGVPPPQIPHFIARLGHARAGTGDPQGALTAFDEAVALAVADDRLTLERMRELIRTEGHIAAGETERARNVLAAELAARRAQGHWMFVRSRPDGAARLAAFALEQGIEADFVHELIRRNELVAPPGAGPSWPFRLRIHALGGFELVRDGEPMRFTGKAQQRPLDLLKLVVAQGPQGVAVQPIIDALWPDADGAAAKTSFDSTLFRLRKLLDIDDVLTLAGGRLSLTRGLAWTDVEALEQAIDGARQVRDGTAAEAAARRLLDAYRGPLFGDDEHTWALRPRDTLRARFVGAIVALGEGIERGGDRGAAAALYRRGLEADNLAESLHRALIRVLAAAGQQAEALNAFRRCRELLSVVLGVQPSDATEALYRQILAGHVGPGA
jgi:DNA-binding SARP family transcriptional activator